MKRPSQHIEWLSLIEVSGPFLAVGLLEKAFPQGLEAVETPRRQKLRAAYDEWCEAVDEDDAQLLALHREWVQLVLADILEYSQEVLFENSDSEEPLEYRDPEHGVAFAPSLVVRSDGDTNPRLLISVYPPRTDLEKVKTNDGWPVSLMERMVLLCRSTGIRLGLLTNGDRWMLVNAPVGATSSHASWYARLWFQEPLTLKAFQSLLGIRRFFGPKDETLDSLLEKSLEYQEEVTDTLGAQVRRAVEVLVQCLDKADQDRNRELLRDVSPSELYEAGLTVMMRLVFVLCAEERGLLLLGDPVYDQCYAVSTLRGHLGEDADRHGPEVLERRHDAWTRLLSVFRAVYGGIEHESLRLPAMGGSLFDPDRFPFLEGRLKGTRWRETPAAPLPIDNRTVLLLLEALQVLEQPGGALLLSYRALDVEQIGHVYEGLLEHTIARVPHIMVGLAGSMKARNPNLPLADLESAWMDGDTALLEILLEATKRSESAIRKDLQRDVDAEDFGRLLLVCGGDMDLAERIRPFANLLRTDAWGEPIVYRANSFMVTLGADRRDTGTHYTPKLLTETIVANTMEPVAYAGPADGTPREAWHLKSSTELLDLKVCDPAMGSGAFLVQACRWLGERVVEAWANEEAAGKVVNIDGEVLCSLDDADPMPIQVEERLILARRLVAERCLYGVDINPLAVELAKLSIWLVTLAKGRPFGFLDHNLRHGDSLLGIHRLDQLTRLSINTGETSHVLPLFDVLVRKPLVAAIALRKDLRSTPIRDIRDVEAMALLDGEARKKLGAVEAIADALVGETLRANGNARMLERSLNELSALSIDYLSGNEIAGSVIAKQIAATLKCDVSGEKPLRKPFHWPLEFPEVFERENPGFDVCVGNPPFITGKRISSILTDSYQTCLKASFADSKGAADICVFFIRQGFRLLRDNAQLGMIGTKSLAEGDSRIVGTLWLLDHGATIYWARHEIPWPGQASVTVSLLAIRKGAWEAESALDGRVVHVISSKLSAEIEKEPFALAANRGLCSDGIKIQGDGFIITNSEKELLLQCNIGNANVIKPYITGMDMVQGIGCCPSSWIISFGTMSLTEASSYSEAFDILVDRVKPYRESLTGQIHEKDFWKFWDKRESFFQSMAGHTRILACPSTAKYLITTFIDKEWVASHSVKLFAFSDTHGFSILQSVVHELWARQQSGKLEQRLAYNLTKAFATFPWPSNRVALSTGEALIELRREISDRRQLCFTDVYNAMHDSKQDDLQLRQLRECHSNVDEAVVSAYGWDDIALSHGFHHTQQGLRFTICERARREILQRLLELNHNRYAEEVAQGLHGKRGKKISPYKYSNAKGGIVG